MTSGKWSLPKQFLIDNAVYPIYSDYRDILEICDILNDEDIDGNDRALIALSLFYDEKQFPTQEHLQKAAEFMTWFLARGNVSADEKNRKTPPIVNFAQDADLICAEINKIIGKDVRSIPYLHWWTFMGYLSVIGDCFLSDVFRIRVKNAKGTRLDENERKFYAAHKDVIDIQSESEIETKKRLNAMLPKTFPAEVI